MNIVIASAIFGGTIAFILLNRKVISGSGAIPKARFERAINGMKAPSTPKNDLPSIVRNRYATARSSDHFSALLARKVAEMVESLEFLGLRLSAQTAILLILFTSLCSGFAVSYAFHISMAIAAMFSTAVTVLLIYTAVNLAKRARMTKFQQLFPDALDLVVRSVRAGLPVSEAIKMISTEIADPVGASFGEVSSKVSIGISLQEALAHLSIRIPIPELRFFAISLTVQQETGGNLAEILSNLSKLMRKRFQVKKKIRALSSEARASALIIGSLPFIVGAVIFSFNRSYIEVLLIEEDGRFLLACALTSIATGGAIMAKLIRFRI